MSEKKYTINRSDVADMLQEKIVVISEVQGDIPTHDHDFFELAYVTGGTALHTLNGIAGMVKKGDYFLVDYGSVHSYTKSRDFTLINCLFMPEVVDDTLVGCQSAEELLKVCLIRYHKQYYGQTIANQFIYDRDGSVEQILLDMQAEYRQKQFGSAEVIRFHLIEILIKALRNMLPKKLKLYPGKATGTLVLDAIAYINKNYSKKAVLSQMCKEYHYSLQYVSRIFHEETGITASEYVKRVRMEHCCKLLVGSNMQIKEIARSAGYEDAAYFRRIFTQIFQMSPREYRKL